MAAENQTNTGFISTPRGSTPTPDPTELTDRAIARLEKSITAYIDGQLAVRDERLNGIDEATKLRLSTVVELPGQIAAQVGRLRDVHDERFKSIDTQFKERDTRQERESRDNKTAVDAAFSAQKEAAAKQDEGNQKAIDKSEKATAEKIDKLEQLFKTTTDALRDKIEDVKNTANGSVQQKVGATENRTSTYALIGLLGTVVVVGIAIITFVLAHTP
jgi:cation transport regulator ChaB